MQTPRARRCGLVRYGEFNSGKCRACMALGAPYDSGRRMCKTVVCSYCCTRECTITQLLGGRPCVCSCATDTAAHDCAKSGVQAPSHSSQASSKSSTLSSSPINQGLQCAAVLLHGSISSSHIDQPDHICLRHTTSPRQAASQAVQIPHSMTAPQRSCIQPWPCG